MQLAGSTYLDLLGRRPHRRRAARSGRPGPRRRHVFDLPPDQRFYAGGSATVRGFRYQTLGPQFPDRQANRAARRSRPERSNCASASGAILASPSFWTWARSVRTDSPFSGSWHAGAGVGARYYTPIGPIRLDVAVPLNKLPGGDSFEFYIGIGQAF